MFVGLSFFSRPTVVRGSRKCDRRSDRRTLLDLYLMGYGFFFNQSIGVDEIIIYQLKVGIP